jgi:hypothetical protein
MRAVQILRSLPDVLPARSNEWGLFWLLLGANTATATLAWFVVGLLTG